jgi:hypothetical protein
MRITSALLNSYRSNRWGHINNTADVFGDLRLCAYIFGMPQIIVVNVQPDSMFRFTRN